MSAGVTTARVLERFLPIYRASRSLSPQQAKVLTNIECCRTPALGGRQVACGQCGYTQERYHSCRNRHCPQCQKSASALWLERRREDLLPVPYFHVVFTLPHELNGWVQLHPEVMYALLFKSVSSTLKDFGRDPRRLNGELGMTLVLHTWGQNLSQHVHVHCLIPGGALSDNGTQWHAARSTYLFPVKALSRCYRGSMVSLLRKAWKREALSRIRDPSQFDSILDAVMHKPWVVFAKPTQQHTDRVLSYLARYTYRIALSDRRLIGMNERRVSFQWKDYRSGGLLRTLSLAGEEFVRRWLLHVLPHGLMRIRHYGYLANCHRRRKLEQVRECLNHQTEAEPMDSDRTTPLRSSEPAETYCPRCRQAGLRVVAEIEPRRRRRN